ncbi:MAG: hypothetical protein ACK4YP_22490, partial [Myxococcota bacterium]
MGSQDKDEGREVAAFRAGTEALPPLTERIDRGAAGGHEFERLMNQLLLVHADRNRFVYTPTGGAGGDGGIDGLAANGIPGLSGPVAFQFKWLWDDVNKGSSARQIKDALDRASKARKDLRHWILVTPRDLEPSARAWLDTIEKRRGLAVHHWGQARIEQLLRQCPALLARYYPEEARAYLPGYDGADFATLAARYREKVVIVHNRLETIGIPRESRIELPLADLFIPLRLVPEESGAERLDLGRALADSRSAVVGTSRRRITSGTAYSIPMAPQAVNASRQPRFGSAAAYPP